MLKIGIESEGANYFVFIDFPPDMGMVGFNTLEDAEKYLAEQKLNSVDDSVLDHYIVKFVKKESF
ncbi:hypothetical protein [Virgibacillus natechei]|nr:hypothetical protein [Virgibacillus natechei]UZD14724.1 hypothetical protein OLD84_09575 [Virgibacillus natechei]